MQLFLRHTISVSNIHNEGTKNYTEDNDPFSTFEAYHTEARFYKMKGKEVADEEDVSVLFPIRHPRAGFTRLVTTLECGTVEIYHHFEVPKKGVAKKWIIFHALGDMDRRGKHNDEDDASTSSVILEERYSPKTKKMCQGE